MAKAKKTKTGKWRLRVYNYTDENGKPIYDSITRDTKAECEYAAAESKRNAHARKPDPAKETVGQVVDQYIDLCRILSPTTVSGYDKIRRPARASGVLGPKGSTGAFRPFGIEDPKSS